MSYFPYQWPLRPPYVVIDGPTGPSALPLAGQPWNGVPLCPGHGLPRFPAQLGQCQHAQLNPFAGGSTGVSPCCPTFSGSSPGYPCCAYSTLGSPCGSAGFSGHAPYCHTPVGMVGAGIPVPPGFHFTGQAPPTNIPAGQFPPRVGSNAFPVAPGPVYGGPVPAGVMPAAAAPPGFVDVRPACTNPAFTNVVGSHSNPTSNPGALPGSGTGIAVPDSGALPSSGVGRADSVERSRSRSRARRRRRKNRRRRSRSVTSSTSAASVESHSREPSRSRRSASPASRGGEGRSASVVVSVTSGQSRSQPAAASSTGSKVSGSRCPMPDCQQVVPRLVRHAVDHLPWYALPHTACWICKKQFGKPNTLQLHWDTQHPTVKQALNCGVSRFDDFFEKVEDFLKRAAAFRGMETLRDLYQELAASDCFVGCTTVVAQTAHELYEKFLDRHGQSRAISYSMSPRLNSPALLLHWRVLLQVLIPLSPDQRSSLKSPTAAAAQGTPSNAARASPWVTVVSTSPRVSSAAGSSASGSGGATAATPGKTEWKVVKRTAERIAKLTLSEAVARPPPPPLPVEVGVEERQERVAVGELPKMTHNRLPVGYADVDLRVGQHDFLADAHFHLDKVSKGLKCDMKLQEVAQQRDTPGASPVNSPALPLGYAVTCFMLKNSDSEGPRLPYDTLIKDSRLKLSFCVHPAHAGAIDSANKRTRMVETVVKHSKRAGVVAVGEIGIDNHRNQTQKARDNCKWFLDALLTALQQDPVLNTMPLILHVREAEDGSNDEAAASQCISALRMARVPKEHRIYLHCFVGSQSVANMWTRNYPETVFGLSPRVVAGGCDKETPLVFQKASFHQVMVETDTPSLKFRAASPKVTTPWSTYRMYRWLAAVKGVTLHEALEGVGKGFLSFYRLPHPKT